MASTLGGKVKHEWGLTVTDEEKRPPKVDASGYAIDTTWMVPLEFQAPNKTNFLFKAGNKDYTLDGSSKNSSSSELSLKKKYA